MNTEAQKGEAHPVHSFDEVRDVTAGIPEAAHLRSNYGLRII